MARPLSLPFDQLEDIGDSFVYPGKYSTKLHQQISGKALQFASTRNRAGGEWKFACYKAVPSDPETNGIAGVLVKRVPMDYRRGNVVPGRVINTDGMAAIRSQQWERLAFVFERLSDHEDPIGALIELNQDLKPHEARIRAWMFGKGVINNEDEELITMCENAIT